MEKKCPLNRFEPCIGGKCGMSIQESDGNNVCAIPFIGHELFIMADIAMSQHIHDSKQIQKEANT